MGELHVVTQKFLSCCLVFRLYPNVYDPINGCLETRLGVGREGEGCCANDCL